MENFDKDPRVACKYGANCYQKNPNHKTKFKHPPRKDPPEDSDVSPKAKRLKMNDEDSEQPSKDQDTQSASSVHNISDSDEDSSKEDGNKEESKSTLDIDGVSSKSESGGEDEDDENKLPPSPADVKLSIKQKFLMDLPEDFYSFWDFCGSLSKDKQTEALKDAGLILVGPYEVLSGKISHSTQKKTLSRFLRHWRFYYDPPEFQTVLATNRKDLYHIGYFRDCPEEMPCFLASNAAGKDCTITPMGPNIFSAVNAFLDESKKTIDPFAKIKLSKLQKFLQTWADKKGYPLAATNSAMKQRTRKTVCKTFHGAGLVVPYNKKSDVGYRPLLENNVKLKSILNNIKSAKSEGEAEDAMEALQPIINAANIANDECDFGTSVELGLDLFCFGGKMLDKEASQLLSTGYSLLNREEFAKIAEAHLKFRKIGGKVDMFE